MKRPFSARDHLPGRIDSVAGVRELDRLIIQRMGDDGSELMNHAGEAAFALLLSRWPDVSHIALIAGAGNNGGDAFVVAGLARLHGIDVSLYTLGDLSRQSSSARAAREGALEAGVTETEFAGEITGSAELIVDGLLGTGLNALVQGDFAEAITAMNEHPAPVLALDVPSGLNAATGQQMGLAVQADLTVTFIGVKPGLLTCDGPDVCGDLSFAPLDLGAAEKVRVEPLAERISWHLLDQQDRRLPQRRGNSNKGQHGHALLIGGELGYGGAIRMAAEACARSGAGLISCATRPEHMPVILAARPECMVAGVTSGLELQPLLERATVIGCGPGLGRSSWSELLLQQVLLSDLPVVLDADALNIIASPGWQTAFEERDAVMTPHPGEAARLLNCTVADIQADRTGSAQALAKRYHAVVLLKGQGTVLAHPDGRLAVCTDGNPGMATGGMGDVLTGVITALLAQGQSPWEAALYGCALHSAAADLAVSESGVRGLLATDLMPYLRELVN
ncbi:NAD(P)H-hydrate dehydratase [uncultured Thalassolituus sp.]|uniref:NAD(P)H-hydrate dehydratase n=2 Tax=uncultured Thalassolituus sp. TaxID=285273 RepID=UPI002606E586|nr:NAD(P)H-hydrate dehydratase [uncultured Thalassolituus sp.]